MAVKSPDIQSIPTAKLPPGHTGQGSTAAAKAIEVGGELAVDLITRKRVGDVQEDIEGAKDEFLQSRVGSEEITDDLIADTLGVKDIESLNEEGNAEVKIVMRRLTKLERQVRRGPGRIADLKIQTNHILSQAIARSPGLADEFTSAATSILGFNPIGADIDTIVAADLAAARSAQDQLDVYDQLAKDLELDITLKDRDPIRYYNLVLEEADKQALVASEARSLKLKQNLGTSNKFEFETSMTRMLPGLSFGIQSNVAKQIAPFIGSTGALQDAIETGDLQRLKVNLQQDRDALPREILAEFFSDADFDLTGVDLTTVTNAIRPITLIYDTAIAAIDEGDAIAHLGNIETVAINRLILDVPGLGETIFMAKTFGALGPTILATAEARRATNKVVAALSGALDLAPLVGQRRSVRGDGSSDVALLLNRGINDDFPDMTEEDQDNAIEYTVEGVKLFIDDMYNENLSPQMQGVAPHKARAGVSSMIGEILNDVDNELPVLDKLTDGVLDIMSDPRSISWLQVSAATEDHEVFEQGLIRAEEHELRFQESQFTERLRRQIEEKSPLAPEFPFVIGVGRGGLPSIQFKDIDRAAPVTKDLSVALPKLVLGRRGFGLQFGGGEDAADPVRPEVTFSEVLDLTVEGVNGMAWQVDEGKAKANGLSQFQIDAVQTVADTLNETVADQWKLVRSKTHHASNVLNTGKATNQDYQRWVDQWLFPALTKLAFEEAE